MDYSIMVNGIGHAFLREFGCSYNRCADRNHVANTSLSIIARDEGEGSILYGTLRDCREVYMSPLLERNLVSRRNPVSGINIDIPKKSFSSGFEHFGKQMIVMIALR